MQQLEERNTCDLIEYARNPRKNDHAVDKIAAAIREFGFRIPVIIKSDNTVIDGHLRLKAAKKLKLKTVPVLVADDLTDAQIKAFRISVNKMADLAEWNDELLALELEDLKELDFDISLTGFDDADINDGDPIDLDMVDEIKEECEIKIICSNYNQQQYAIQKLGAKKIKFEDLEAMLR